MRHSLRLTRFLLRTSFPNGGSLIGAGGRGGRLNLARTSSISGTAFARSCGPKATSGFIAERGVFWRSNVAHKLLPDRRAAGEAESKGLK